MTRGRAAAARKPAKEPTATKPAPRVPMYLRRRTFAEAHWSDKAGHPFSLEGRPWVLDHMWRPLDGYKAWPVAWESGRMLPGEKLCTGCLARADKLIDFPDEVDDTRTSDHRKEHGCRGLRATKIIFVVLCLPRREGKTTNAMGYCGSRVFQQKNQLVMYVAAAEDQTDDLVEQNFSKQVRKHPQLEARARIVGSTIIVPNLGSRFVAVATSHRSVTGRGPNLGVIDEARDVDSQTAMAFLNSIYDAGGTVCSACDWKTQAKDDAPRACPVCGSETATEYAVSLVMSAAGIDTGSEDYAWFRELVERLEKFPHPHFYLHRRDDRENPAVSQSAVRAVEEVFGEMESTRHLVRAEAKNQFTRKGEDFLSDTQVARCIDNSLKNHEGSTRRCVAFLDTSDVNELTSLVILGEEEHSPEPFSHTLIERIDYWDPKALAGGVIDVPLVLSHLDLFLPMFPGLQTFAVDTRLRPWARKLVHDIKTGTMHGGGRRGYGRVTMAWDKGPNERAVGYAALESAVIETRTRMPNHPILRAEFRGVRATRNLNNQLDVRDRNRKRRHADILEGLAGCHYLAHEQAIRQRARSFKELEEKDEIHQILQRAFPKPIGGGSSGFGSF